MTIETIVVIILAVAVLTLLLGWLNKDTGPAMSITAAQTEMNNGCFAYKNNGCQTGVGVDTKKIADACTTLAKNGFLQIKADACLTKIGNDQCIKECCQKLCPLTNEKKSDLGGGVLA